MATRTSIHLEWDKGGRLSHRISGHLLPPPRDDPKLWVLAPSVPLLLAHQCGVMKPSHGLATCASLLDMLFHNRYVLMPINSALKGARIDFIYTSGPSVGVLFHPRHGIFASSDSLEEGVRQLINNYAHYVYTNLDEYTRIVLRTFVSATIAMYFVFIESEIQARTIGPGQDKWLLSFTATSVEFIRRLSERYYVPEGGRTSENEEWAQKQTAFPQEDLIRLESKRDSLFLAMGLH